MANNKRNNGKRAQSAATPASATMPTASTSHSLVHQPRNTDSLQSTATHQPRELTLFCWILDISDRSFPVDIGDDRTVGHLKDAIVKKNPVSFEGVDAYKLDLWKVSGFPPFSTYADNFPTRRPFRLTGNSRIRSAINSFLKRMCYRRETRWRKSFRYLNLQRRGFTSLYDIRILVSHLFDPSLLVKSPLTKCNPADD
jgi:hypothetical protein